MDHSMSESQHRIKRRKIAVACDDCRARKVRCDGIQPGMFLAMDADGMRPVLTQCSVWAMQQEDRPGAPMRLYRGVREEASKANVSVIISMAKSTFHC